MAITRIDIDQFLLLAAQHPVIDVRSEGEFAHAHFPGAHSLPLFNNEERKVVGTAYKQESQQKAIKIGMAYFGKKMVAMVEQVEQLTNTREAPFEKTVLLYCWRGGMRSGGVAWMLDLYGFKVYTLVGGYKAFRQWGLAQMEQQYPIKLIGGYTGSAKTELLHYLGQRGNAVVDLEALASHKGSAFGNIGMPPQPSQEMFENKLALGLWTAMGAGNNTPPSILWLEDESQRIGTVNIPTPLFSQMRQKPLIFLDIPFDARLGHIVAGYGKGHQERLINAIVRIKKRLGGLDTKLAINHLVEGDTRSCFGILLHYYDRQYSKALADRDPALILSITCASEDAAANASLIFQHLKTTHV